jgi:hypothetical protein
LLTYPEQVLTLKDFAHVHLAVDCCYCVYATSAIHQDAQLQQRSNQAQNVQGGSLSTHLPAWPAPLVILFVAQSHALSAPSAVRVCGCAGHAELRPELVRPAAQRGSGGADVDDI